MNCRLTSFATYQDLVGFCDAVENGSDFDDALRHGDNGRGASGKVTAQTKTPMVAVSKHHIEARWGSLSHGWGKKIRVTFEDKSAVAELADYCSASDVCDCNPAMLLVMGWSQDEKLNVPGEWHWASDL